jgi:hypothetical protein
MGENPMVGMRRILVPECDLSVTTIGRHPVSGAVHGVFEPN